jgi:hypothetical protein
VVGLLLGLTLGPLLLLALADVEGLEYRLASAARSNIG